MSTFRILDLGAHDGFVTNFIARQARNSGIEVHVDGIEANPQGVRLFNERLERDGLSGRCHQGLAEDAPTIFERRSYDAVVAFEIIEHAPDVDLLLAAAGSMTKPGGRVYISTPNGTFGAGNNPHHLRTWTLHQLYRILRKHGEVVGALPGPDGVSVIAYEPNSTALDYPEVAIYTGPGWEKWSPFDIERKGLGGSETAAARLAEALSHRGFRVTVYGECEHQAAGQVSFEPHTAFDPMDERYLVISSRIPELADRTINAEHRLLWMHDTDCGPRLTEQRAAKFDRIMVLSRWHERHVRKLYPFLNKGQLYVTRNGIEPSYFTDGTVERNPHRAVYTSSPDRGLDLLLELWPNVRERVPDAELAFAYASVYEAVAAKDPRIAEFRQYIDLLASSVQGAIPLGSLTQPGVAKEMRSSGVWLAPSWSTPAGVPFNETFCIGAVEAAAAGCHRVMSHWGGLRERDEGESIWIPGRDGQFSQAEWVDAIAYAMEHPLSTEASPQALRMTWGGVADDMLEAVQ